MEYLTQFLEYGLAGLAAILCILSYRLLHKESDNPKPRQSMLRAIKSFALMCIVLVVISAISNSVELFTGSATQEELHQRDKELVEAKAEITRLEQKIAGNSTSGELGKKLGEARQEIERLKLASKGTQELAQVKTDLAAAQRTLEEREAAVAAERELTSRLVADRLMGGLSVARVRGKVSRGGGPGRRGDNPSEPAIQDSAEVYLNLLKRSVFENLAVFDGDASVLEGALRSVVRRGRTEFERHTATVVEDLGDIMRMRLRWLEDIAIPALQEDIRSIGVEQRSPMARVLLPRALWILDYAPGKEPATTVFSITQLRSEASFIKGKLDESP